MATKYLKNNQSTIAKDYHILNGDALLGQFPAELKNENVIVFREMLMDGPLSEVLDSSFYQARSEYIEKLAGENARYTEKVRPQLQQIKNLPDGSRIYLWFEHDLFCQVNLWSCVTWLSTYVKDLRLFFVSPPTRDWRGFGGMAEEDLSQAFRQARLLEDRSVQLYREALRLFIGKDVSEIEAYTEIEGLDLTIKGALLAELTRLPNADGKFVLHQVIKKIGQEEDGNFAKTFQRFCKEHGVYGIGDLQFRSLFDKLVV